MGKGPEKPGNGGGLDKETLQSFDKNVVELVKQIKVLNETLQKSGTLKKSGETDKQDSIEINLQVKKVKKSKVKALKKELVVDSKKEQKKLSLILKIISLIPCLERISSCFLNS